MTAGLATFPVPVHSADALAPTASPAASAAPARRTARTLAAVGLALPVAVAPVALRPLPGGGVLQVIHLAVVLAVAAVLVATASGRVRARVPASAVVGVLLVGALLLAAALSDDPFAGLKIAANHLLGLALAATAAALVREDRRALRVVLRVWTVAGAAAVLPALGHVGTVSAQFGGALVAGRLTGTFAQPNDFGEFAVLLLVAAAALAAGASRWGDRLLGLAGVMLASAALVMSLSRGAWLGAAAAAVVAVLLAPRLIAPVAALGSAAAAVTVFGAVTGLNPYAALADRGESLFRGSVNPDDERQFFWHEASRLWSERPWFGWGPGTFRDDSLTPGSTLVREGAPHAHNVILQLGAEAGAVGVVALAVITIVTAWLTVAGLVRLRAAGRGRDATMLAVLAAGLVGVAVHGLIDVTLTNPFLIASVWLLWGLVIGAAAAARRDAGAAGRVQAGR